MHKRGKKILYREEDKNLTEDAPVYKCIGVDKETKESFWGCHSTHIDDDGTPFNRTSYIGIISFSAEDNLEDFGHKYIE